MARPKKDKFSSKRACPVTVRSSFDWKLEGLRVDPTNGESLSMFFRRIIGGSADAEFKGVWGEWMVRQIEELPCDDLEDLFRKILKMKRNYDKPPRDRHRNWRALKIFKEFVDEHGFVPTKRKLKRHILELGIHDMPGEDDFKGWTRLWEDIGLGKLES